MSGVRRIIHAAVRRAALAVVVLTAASCAANAAQQSTVTEAPATASAAATIEPPTTIGLASTAPATTSSPPPATTSTTVATTIAATTIAATTIAATTIPATTTTAATTTTVPDTVEFAYPVPDTNSSYARTHSAYSATDIFAACGATVVSPVDGVIVHWRTEDLYVRGNDNPARRGGRSFAVLGDDGVRYYMSHFESMEPGLGVGARVAAGQPLAVLGESGDAGACHIHFGLSPNCPALEWSVRRGVIWPWPYLDAWRAGEQRSPREEILAWQAANPDACAAAAADRYAADAG